VTLYKNSAQSPSAAGTAISAASMALPDTPSLIVPGTGGAITIETTTGGPGTKEIRVTSAAATQGYWGYTGMTGGGNSWSLRGLWKSPSTLPSSLQPIILFRSSGGGNAVGTIAISTTNHFQVVADTAGTSTQSTNAMAANTWYDLEIRGENGTISTGVVTLTVRNLSNVEDTDLSTSHGGALGAGTANFGTTVVAHFRLGKTGTAGNLGPIAFKYWTFQTGSNTSLPQPGANTPPSVPAISNKVQAASGATTFTAVPTDAEGDTLTHSWVITRLSDAAVITSGVTGATTATVSIPNQGTAGPYSVVDSVSDGTDTTVATAYLLVRPASGVAVRPYRVISNAGLWTPGGTAATVVAGLAGDATAWIISPDAPAAASVVVAMPAPALGHYNVEFYLEWRSSDDSTSVSGVTGPTTCQVFQGTTPVTSQAIFTRTVVGEVLCQVSFSGAEDTALSADMTDIRIELTSSQT
jgi:hypothetical protein